MQTKSSERNACLPAHKLYYATYKPRSRAHATHAMKMDGLTLQELLQLILTTDTYSSRLTQYQPPVTQFGSNHFVNSSQQYQVHDFYLLHFINWNLCLKSSRIIHGNEISTPVLDVVLATGSLWCCMPLMQANSRNSAICFSGVLYSTTANVQHMCRIG